MDSEGAIFVVKRLAKEWMIGTRQGSARRAWEHPQDVADIVQTVPGMTDVDRALGVAVAWGHDLLEDGIKEGRPVTALDLLEEGVPSRVVAGIEALTKVPSESFEDYCAKVQSAEVSVRVAKCCDRIANLTEGMGFFNEKRWARYVAETRNDILPLAEGLPEPMSSFLKDKLQKLLAQRPTL